MGRARIISRGEREGRRGRRKRGKRERERRERGRNEGKIIIHFLSFFTFVKC
jgi:hypothetical protein